MSWAGPAKGRPFFRARAAPRAVNAGRVAPYPPDNCNEVQPMAERALRTNLFDFRRYGDVVLAFGVMAIMCLMVLRLPTSVIDVLVAVNIAFGIALLLVALYVPHPVAFNSFPSVLLLTTLFRLSLSIATTRLILLDADAGHIIDAFGRFVAGGNLVVGIVVFIIITIVQFIVIAKGAERVAEVAARFTLDAMPGKQLSIDSDLRSGLIDKDEAKRRRSLLERESQLNGALDGAMKFVKGDAIASIIIVIVNLLGGLTIGMLQRDMSAGDAMHLYSILTIGDGMVAQIPALLSAMAAGLIVTRSAGDDARRTSRRNDRQTDHGAPARAADDRLHFAADGSRAGLPCAGIHRAGRSRIRARAVRDSRAPQRRRRLLARLRAAKRGHRAQRQQRRIGGALLARAASGHRSRRCRRIR